MRDQILIELRLLINQISNSREKFGNNDIRSSFLDGYFETLKTYFCAYFHLEEKDILEKYYEIYQRNDFCRGILSKHLHNQRNALNSLLIIFSWSNFELFITLFCKAVLSKTKIVELLEHDYRNLIKILKSYSITDKTDNKLKKCIKKDLAHTPIINKYGKLLKIVNPYPSNRNKQADLEFLEFFGRLRNCMHSNYIYYGTTQNKFTYNDITFIFKNGKPISQNPLRESSTYELTKNLKDIVQVIMDNINHEHEIYDPSVAI